MRHSFFCNCSACKYKRKNSGCYIGLIGIWILILLYQALITMFFTLTFNAVILFIEIAIFFVLILGIIL